MPLFYNPARDLLTLRDVLRYGVSLFERAELAYGHGTDNAHDEAAFILLEGLKLPIDTLEPYLDARLTRPERDYILSLFRRRVKTRKPAPYLLRRAYIQGLPFYVDERVIVPRSFIAEILCDNPDLMPGPVYSVLDLCTGSGCLAVLAAQLYPDAHIDAVDLSADALAVARRNVDDYGLDHQITLHQGDLFAPLAGRKYDLIITNPPYVDGGAIGLLPDEYRHEPVMALAGGDDGMDLVRRILAEAPSHMNPGGLLLCEVGMGRDVIERDFPDLPCRWHDTAGSRGEVFSLSRAAA